MLTNLMASIDPNVAIDALNNSLVKSIKTGNEQELANMLRLEEGKEMPSGVLADGQCIFELAAQFQRPTMMKMLAESLYIKAAFDVEQESPRNLWILRIFDNEKTLPYVVIYLKYAHVLHREFGPYLLPEHLKNVFKQLLEKATRNNHYAIVKQLLDKKILNDASTGEVLSQERETADMLFNIAIEETKDPQMIALFKRYKIGLNRIASMPEPDFTQPIDSVELALTLPEQTHSVFFILEHYFTVKLAASPAFNDDILCKLKIFSEFIRMSLERKEPLIIEENIKTAYENAPFPTKMLIKSNFKMSCSALLAYRGNELFESANHYLNALTAQPHRTPLQSVVIGLVLYGDNLLFQLHFMIFIQKNSEALATTNNRFFNTIKSPRWLENLCKVLTALADRDAIDMQQFNLIIQEANTGDLIGGFSRTRKGEFHKILAKLPELSAEDLKKQFNDYCQFTKHHSLDPDINHRVHDTLKAHKNAANEALRKKTG